MGRVECKNSENLRSLQKQVKGAYNINVKEVGCNIKYLVLKIFSFKKPIMKPGFEWGEGVREMIVATLK